MIAREKERKEEKEEKEEGWLEGFRAAGEVGNY